MAHSDTYIDSSLPFGLARVAAVTGNPMLDIGYQCRDSRPYFAFTNELGTLYTTLAPSKATPATTVDVYQLGSKVVDGVTYDAMELVGTGTQTGSLLDMGLVEVTPMNLVSENTYTNTDNAHVDIRLHNINKWSRYKPQVYDKLGPLTDDERAAASYPYGIKVVNSDDHFYYHSLHEQAYAYVGLPGEGDIARLTDFAGYHHDDTPGLSAEISISGTVVTVKFNLSSQSLHANLLFYDLINALSGSPLTSHYPYLLASMADSDGETFNTHYLTPLKVNGNNVTFQNSSSERTADLSEVIEYVIGRKWKLTVFFYTELISEGWTPGMSSTTEVEKMYVLPGAQALEFTGVGLTDIS